MMNGGTIRQTKEVHKNWALDDTNSLTNCVYDISQNNILYYTKQNNDPRTL